MPKIISDETIKRAYQLYLEDGESLRSVSEKQNIAFATLVNRFKALGLNAKPKRRKIKPPPPAGFKEFYIYGLTRKPQFSQATVARLFGVSRQYVFQLVEKIESKYQV